MTSNLGEQAPERGGSRGSWGLLDIIIRESPHGNQICVNTDICVIDLTDAGCVIEPVRA
jgi:hypothetical protein